MKAGCCSSRTNNSFNP